MLHRSRLTTLQLCTATAHRTTPGGGSGNGLSPPPPWGGGRLSASLTSRRCTAASARNESSADACADNVRSGLLGSKRGH
eukprot:6174980-Pleurochrysis_carterae.AAC.2